MRSLADRFVCLSSMRVCMCGCTRRRQRVQRFALCFAALNCITIFFSLLHMCLCFTAMLHTLYTFVIWPLKAQSTQPTPIFANSGVLNLKFLFVRFQFCISNTRLPAVVVAYAVILPVARSLSHLFSLARAQLRQLRVSLVLSFVYCVALLQSIETGRVGERESKLSVVVFV